MVLSHLSSYTAEGAHTADGGQSVWLDVFLHVCLLVLCYGCQRQQEYQEAMEVRWRHHGRRSDAVWSDVHMRISSLHNAVTSHTSFICLWPVHFHCLHLISGPQMLSLQHDYGIAHTSRVLHPVCSLSPFLFLSLCWSTMCGHVFAHSSDWSCMAEQQTQSGSIWVHVQTLVHRPPTGDYHSDGMGRETVCDYMSTQVHSAIEGCSHTVVYVRFTSVSSLGCVMCHGWLNYARWTMWCGIGIAVCNVQTSVTYALCTVTDTLWT